MADAYGNPFQSITAPNMRQASLWDLRMMSAANRMETPFERGARGTYRHPLAEGTMLGGLAGMANEPDYSSFTFNPTARAQATQALAPYGQAPLAPEDVRRNALLPNTGFFARHPGIAGALEGGLFAAAASHGGDTIGDSIQGVAQGLIGGHRIQQGLYRQQFARPFEAAGMMENLQDAQQRRELQGAQIKRYESESEIQAERAQLERDKLDFSRQNDITKDQFRLQQIEATAPRNLGEGLYGYYNPGGTGPNQKGNWAIQENPEAIEFRKASGRAQAQAGMLKGIVTEPDPKNPSQTRQRYVEVAPGQPFPKGFQPMQVPYDQRQGDQADKARATQREAFIKANTKPSKLLGFGYTGNMNDAKAQISFLGNLWDQTHPEEGGPPEASAAGSSQDNPIVIK